MKRCKEGVGCVEMYKSTLGGCTDVRKGVMGCDDAIKGMGKC